MFFTTASLLWLSHLFTHLAWGQARQFDMQLEDLRIFGHSDYFDNAYGELEMNDDDQLVANVRFEIRQNLDDLCNVRFKAYRLRNGEYLEFYERQAVSLCDFVEQNQIILTDLAQYGNLPSHCPYTPKDIQINGYRLDPKVFPDDLSSMDVKADTVISCKSDNGENVEALKIFAKIRIVDIA
ncbi:hypothetical protein BDV27DRAFT_157517 [Aspergillus caelatus]|uniref:Phosphatidylglycerol/phosphatidylinositol transfer protein n=1 Tax=Aspergillus caelatus TaxID=61420 RepID=A0A5N7A4Z4_9EURO|nr:uncharacterized protein BDV27DRAFT_157517 [Aspergillus caelatus]KAE8364755.1 hypothetical protein BDV27DRAFT_157517 [Aspergillus caelatus]